MKIFMMTDLEGVAGVTSFKQTRDFHNDIDLYITAKRLLTDEVNASIRGIMDANFNTDIYIVDGHGYGGLDFDLLDNSSSVNVLGNQNKLTSDFDAVFVVGQHAMAGTKDANLAHTRSSLRIKYYKLNGIYVGEFACLAAKAGYFDIPVVFISGDDKAVIEAKEICNNIYSATTKYSISLEEAESLSHSESCRIIREESAKALLGMQKIKPFILDAPYTLEIGVYDNISIDKYLSNGATKKDNQTVIFEAENLLDIPFM